MRLFLAAFCFLASVSLITSGIIKLLPENSSEWFTAVAILASAVLSLFLTNLLVNVRGTKFWRVGLAQVSVEDLEQQGLLSTTEFHAKRAFQVEELHDEGSNYFLELKDGSVLFLNGHYFFEYEPLEVDGSIVQCRAFPCTVFVLRRDGEERSVDIECRGRVLEPEVVTPPFAEEDFRNKALPKDGDIITSATYDEVKKDRLEQRRLGGWVVSRRSGRTK